MSNCQIRSLLPVCFGLCLSFSLQASASTTLQTQSKLRQLDAQINHLKQSLGSAQNKRRMMHQKLSATEKQIGENVFKLHTLEKEIHDSEGRAQALQGEVDKLNQNLLAQQQALASHIKARYKLSEYQPLKWLSQQHDPNRLSQILTWYQYLIKARQHLILAIGETRKTLHARKSMLDAELQTRQSLQQTLLTQQQQLVHNKTLHATLIQSLSREIQGEQHDLNEAQKNRENLGRILQALASESIKPAGKPFLRMRRKLPFPVQTSSHSWRRMNQGVTFFAAEGTPVTAVFPGKVVFSDWLKGYGLLLILDHGQGFMSLYAHNQSLFASRGQQVHQGEQIASVGHSGGIKQNGLYFEIRQGGKAVQPLAWLS